MYVENLALNHTQLDTILGWLKRHRLATLTAHGWVRSDLPKKGICWRHGLEIPCIKCEHIATRSGEYYIGAVNHV